MAPDADREANEALVGRYFDAVVRAFPTVEAWLTADLLGLLQQPGPAPPGGAGG